MLPLTHQLTNSDVCSARNDQIRQVTQQPPLSVIVNPALLSCWACCSNGHDSRC